MNPETITERFTQLESQNKRLRIAAVTMLAAAAGLLCLAAAPQVQSFNAVKTQRFEVVDEGGKTRACLSTRDDGLVSFTMTPTASEKSAVQIYGYPSGRGTLAISNASESKDGTADKSGIVLDSGVKLGCGLHIFGKDGLRTIGVSESTAVGPAIQLFNEDREERFVAWIGEKGQTCLAMRGAKGNPGEAHLEVMADAGSCLSLYKAMPGEGGAKSASSMEIHVNNPDMGQGIRTFQKGKERLLFACEDPERANLCFRDEAGAASLGVGFTGDACWMDFFGSDERIKMALRSDEGGPARIVWCGDDGKIIKSIEGRK